MYGRKRYEEFEAFFAWLIETIEREQVEVLLVAGDVFDTSAPSNRSQALYYDFLRQAISSTCRHIVVIAGNHDSPSFLDAPRALLRALDVQVIGAAADNRADEVLVLRNQAGAPELLVCAVPYLRDRDLRVAEAGESMEDKERKLLAGLRAHYAEVTALAEQKRLELGGGIPIVAMGHLFTAGGRTVDGDGVRALYVGSLGYCPAGIFPDSLDYLALGHLHVPQQVAGSEVRRYSGSPLPMGFGEAKQQKSVCLVEFAGIRAAVRLLQVPLFQELERVRGGWDALADRIRELSAAGSQAWLEVIYEGDQVMGDLRQRLEMAIAGSGLEILRVENKRIIDQVLEQLHDGETLVDLNVNEVFERCLSAHQVPTEQRPELLRAYQEILTSCHEDDSRAA